MNIQFVSDLHLDQLEKIQNENLVKPNGDILILGGDICHIITINKYIDFFRYLSTNFQYILYIPGNHEFYSNERFSICYLENCLKNFLKNFNNIVYLNNYSIIINDILFTGSCLWCKPSTEPPPWFKANINKNDICKMHQESVCYLQKVSELRYNKHVIITHYPPMQFEHKKINKYDDYYINSDILLDFYPKYWIFGHTHKNIDTIINDTKYLSNQRKDKSYNNSRVFVV